MIKICPVCKNEFKAPRKETINCSFECYRKAPVSEETRKKMSEASKGRPKTQITRLKISLSTKGKPKPWILGEKNPNFGGKAINSPEIRKKILEKAKENGQSWTDETKAKHSELMKGNSNWMRGKKHTEESKELIRKSISKNFEFGEFNSFTRSISKAEKEIMLFLDQNGIKYIDQFIIKGSLLRYDFYLVEKNLIVEYYGDYWHGNPLIYSEDRILGRGEKKYSARDKWISDQEKNNFAENNGYPVKIIWESDYNKRKGEILNEFL